MVHARLRGRRRARPAPAVARTVALGMTDMRFALSPLRGSAESLVRQNTKSEDEGLERILDDEDLNDRIARGALVHVPTSSGLVVNETLPENRRYCRPWTASFLADLTHAHNAQFRHPLYVSSAVRTVEFQKQLIHVNGNAAAAEGDVVSPHLTGGTIDIAKDGMSRQEMAWMRAWLLPLQQAGHIDVEEEFLQPCFHITVYNTYEAPMAPSEPLLVQAAADDPAPVTRATLVRASFVRTSRSRRGLAPSRRVASGRSVTSRRVQAGRPSSRRRHVSSAAIASRGR